MQADGYRNRRREQEPGLLGIGTEPSFAIGQRALLLQTPQGNVLWDCISYVDDETTETIGRLGGIKTIAISHPHFYSSMVEWAQRFNARIAIPVEDRIHVVRASDRITFWQGDTYPLADGVTLVRLGGHFAGSSVLHWRDGAEGRGALFSGDTIQVVADPNWVSFMYSYPNLIPLPGAEVQRIASTVATYKFDRIYGGWFDRVTRTGAKAVIQESAERYVRALHQTPP
jgi:glyoxylase-like metal-dependent hydrolase (beta-lactamase superfamily II)